MISLSHFHRPMNPPEHKYFILLPFYAFSLVPELVYRPSFSLMHALPQLSSALKIMSHVALLLPVLPVVKVFRNFSKRCSMASSPASNNTSYASTNINVAPGPPFCANRNAMS